MKYLGLIVDDKDIATKEYVDAHTDKPTHTQTFTLTTASPYWYYRIPYNEDYTFEDLLNFRAHFERDGSAPFAASIIDFNVGKFGDYWSYGLFFRNNVSTYFPAAGDTIVIENMFTDTDGVLVVSM